MASSKTRHGIPAYLVNGKAAQGDTADEVLGNAGLDFKIGKENLFTEGGKQLDKRFMRTFREDTDQTFGVVGHGYEVIQNADVLAISDKFVENKDMTWDRIGVRKHGADIWGSFKLNEGFSIKGFDDIDQYVYLCNSNDGNGALKIVPANIRPMCTNQYAHWAGTLKAAGINLRDLTIRHSSKMSEKIDKLGNALEIVDHLNENFVLQAEEMMELELSIPEREEFYISHLGLKTDSKLKAKDNKHGLKTRGMNALNAVFEVEGHRNNTVNGIGGTAWGTYNTLTQYLDHNWILNGSGDVKASAADSAIFGTAGRMKAKAFDDLVARTIV